MHLNQFKKDPENNWYRFGGRKNIIEWKKEEKDKNDEDLSDTIGIPMTNKIIITKPKWSKSNIYKTK